MAEDGPAFKREEVTVLRYIAAQLRRRPGRSLALLLAILAATTGFTVLTATTATSRLKVVGTVRSNYRGVYDILVRPKGARTEPERERGLVAGNTLSGSFGGITVAQWERIREVTGVEVAAPIAMAGTVPTEQQTQVDLTDLVDRRLTRQFLRTDLTWHADRGLTNVHDDNVGLVYVTKRPVVFLESGQSANLDKKDIFQGLYEDGVYRPKDVCGFNWVPPYEIQEDGRVLPLCFLVHPWASGDVSTGAIRYLAQLLPNGTFRQLVNPSGGHGVETRARLTVPVQIQMSLLLAGIDPEEESALVGLDSAIVRGTYLTKRTGRYDTAPIAPLIFEGTPNSEIVDDRPRTYFPVLMASGMRLDERGTLAVGRVNLGARSPAGHGEPAVNSLAGGPASVQAERTVSSQAVFDNTIRYSTLGLRPPYMLDNETLFISPRAMVRSGQPRYEEQPDGSLRALPAPSATTELGALPWLARDTAVRPVIQVGDPLSYTSHSLAFAEAVGVYDPTRLREAGDTEVPLESYHAPQAPGADGRSRELLGRQALLPNGNPGNYLAPSPTLLTSIQILEKLEAPDDLISAVRVRVGGITGFDAVNRERIRLVAEDIAKATGLDVDITMGSSASPQTIVLPKGRFGRPELRLAEDWTLKGVAVSISEAVDRKSAALFVLILAVCALFLANATGAAVRHRRRDLAVLACVGWPRRRLAGLTLGEVGAIGLVGGALSVGLSTPLAHVIGVDLPWRQAALAIPIALALALLAGVVPALRAARAHPLGSVHVANPARAPRRIRRRSRRLPGIALANLARVPGRSVLAVTALAVAVCALTLLAAVMITFRGTLVGSLLGEAVSVRIRNVDAAAVIAIVVLATFAVADVLYLGIRERASEFGALKATGWSAGATIRLIGYEALGIGALAAVLGAGAGLAGAARLAGELPPGLIAIAAAAAAAGPVLAVLAAIVPALMLRRLPTTTVLAEE